jgi:hypothetical protein
VEPPRDVFDRQLRLIEAGDLDGLLEQYDEDAVLVRFDRVVAGREGLREFFAGYLAAEPRVRSVDAYAETDEVVSYQATLDTAGGEVRGYGVFVLRDGKIWRQVAGVFG